MLWLDCPDSKVHGANMGPIWGRQDPGAPHVGLMNFAIREEVPTWGYENRNTLIDFYIAVE